MDTYWYIWSIEHDAWWKKDGNGYTNIFDLAGEFTYEEACRIVENANIGMERTDRPNEAMIAVNQY